MSKVKKIRIEKGYYLLKLEQQLKEKRISINKLMRDTNTDFKVIKRLMTGDLARVDLVVLARLCNYLDCKICDLIEYHNDPIKSKKYNHQINHYKKSE